MLGQWRLDRGPLWQRLGNRVITLVDEGALPDDAPLPTERALAELLGVSRSTTTAAYRHVRQSGRLHSRQGSGSRTRRPPGATRSRPVEDGAFSTLGRSPAGVIDLSLAEARCDHHTRAAIDDLDPGWLTAGVRDTGYHPQGLPALRLALAEQLGLGGPEQILVTTGAQQAIALTASVLCPPGSTVLVEEASYPGALEVFRRLGARVLPVPTDRHGPEPQALAALAERTRPRLVYLVPVGNNPTGVIVPGHRLDALADALARSGSVLLEDRTAVPLADPDDVPAALSARLPAGTAVTVGSMSKVAWAGLRTGWVVAAPGLLRELLAARIATDLAGSAISQLLATRLVPRLPELAAAVRGELAVSRRALRAALAEQLPEWSAPEPAAGAWQWVRIPADARLFTRAAAAEGVLVTPGPLFSPQALLTDRLRLATVEPAEVLVEAVGRLRRAWESVQHAPSASTRDDGRDLLLI